MGDLSQHFNRHEFACKCGCGQDTVDYELVKLLEHLRHWAGSPITITSGNRCKAHNERVGGSPNSQHLLGKAADIQVKGWSPEDIYKVLEEWCPYSHGVGLYKGWVHVDVRDKKSRWIKE